MYWALLLHIYKLAECQVELSKPSFQNGNDSIGLHELRLTI
jgi:hypothetical protein